MRLLTVLTLVVFGYAHAQEDDCYRLWPTGWHLLNPNSTDDRSGLLLAEANDQLYTIMYSTDEPIYKEICNSEEYKVHQAYWYFSEEELYEFPSAYIDDPGHVMACNSSASTSFTYLECGPPKPYWSLDYVGIIYLNNQTGEVKDGSEGLLVVALHDKNGKEEGFKGTVCNDEFNSYAANLTCQLLGYKFAETWGSYPQNFDYLPAALLDEWDVPVAIDSLNCSKYRHEHLDDCEIRSQQESNCSHADNVWIKCHDETQDGDWYLADAGLYSLNNRTEEVEKGSEGLLVVHFENADDPRSDWLSGLVCDDKFNSHAANLSCQYLGYGYAEAWGSHPENLQYLPKEFLEEYDIPILIDDVQCSAEDRNITDCDASVLEGHDCDISESLWLKCAKDESDSDWVFRSADLIRWNNSTKEVELGNEGLLVVHFEDRSGNEEESLSGTVCDDSFNDHAANLSCQYLGYKYAIGWGSEPQNFRYLPAYLIHEWGVPILVDDVQCDSWTSNIMECEARALQGHDCDTSENLWLRCSSEGGDEDFEGLEFKFGGAKVSLNLNKMHRKWIF